MPKTRFRATGLRHRPGWVARAPSRFQVASRSDLQWVEGIGRSQFPRDDHGARAALGACPGEGSSAPRPRV